MLLYRSVLVEYFSDVDMLTSNKCHYSPVVFIVTVINGILLPSVRWWMVTGYLYVILQHTLWMT